MLNSFKEYDYCFFTMMGKYFSRKDIIKELDCQLYSNENMTWYVLYNDINDVIGFASLEKKKTKLYLDNFYIIPHYRGNKYMQKILDKIIDENFYETIELITRNPIAEKIFLKNGFKSISQNGRYKKMIRGI